MNNIADYISNSAKKYYDYLYSHNKGIEKIKVIKN